MKSKITTPHAVNTFKEREGNPRTKMLWEISGMPLPMETQKRIIDTFRLPASTVSTLTNNGFLAEEPLAWQKIFWDANKRHLQETFLPKYDEKCLTVFVEEIGFIIAMYFAGYNSTPTRNDLFDDYDSGIKVLSKKMASLDKAVHRVMRKKTTWPYLHDTIIKSYVTQREKHGVANPSAYHAERFFTLLSWMKDALNNMPAAESEFEGHSAKGKNQFQRDNALIALADSYERCFDTTPTLSIGGNYRTCATLLLDFLEGKCKGGNENNEIRDYTDLIKTILRRHRSRKIKAFKQSKGKIRTK